MCIKQTSHIGWKIWFQSTTTLAPPHTCVLYIRAGVLKRHYEGMKSSIQHHCIKWSVSRVLTSHNYFSLCVNNYECLWGVCTVIPICMNRPSSLFVLSSIVALQNRCKHFCFDILSDDNLHKQILALQEWGWEASKTHGYPRKSRLSTEWFLQRLTNVQQSTQPHMVSRLSRAAIRTT